MGNAKLNEMYGKQSPLEKAMLKIEGKLKEFVEANANAENNIVKKSEVLLQYPKDFVDGIGDTLLRGLDHNTRKFYTIPLKDYVLSKVSMNKFLWVIGLAGLGKTQLLRSLGREFSAQLGLPTFLLTDSYDSMGVLTRSHKMNQGAIIFDDAKFEVKLNEKLTLMDMIAITSVFTACSVNCRYHAGIMPKNHPRLAGLNPTRDYDGGNNFGGLFEEAGFHGLAALARGDEKWFASCPEQEVAIARRSLVMIVKSSILPPSTIELLGRGDDAEMALRLARSEAARA